MKILASALLLSVAASNAAAQWHNEVRPFASGAAMIGAQGFARPPITSAVANGFVHLPIDRFLVGVQGGWTFAESARSHASYALGTIAYPRQRAAGWQAYPFVGVGGASFRTETVAAQWKPAFGAGLGFDALTGSYGGGAVIALRVGYITRGLNDDASVAYAAMGLGLGGRRESGKSPGGVVVRSPNSR